MTTKPMTKKLYQKDLVKSGTSLEASGQRAETQHGSWIAWHP